MFIFGQNVRFMSTSKPPNMKVKLLLSVKIDTILDLGVAFFWPKKSKARAGNDLDL